MASFLTPPADGYPAALRRFGRRVRGDVPTGYWLILLLVFAVEYWWWHSRTKMWDGDALYYFAAALKYAGHSTNDALRQTGVFFHQESTVDRIRGTLTGVKGQPGAGAYNLETPRFFYSALAVPFVLAFGAKGIWVVSLLCGAAFLYVLMRLLTRLFDAQIALATVLLYLVAFAFWFFQTGIYTESLAALLIVLILTRLPLGRTSTRRDLIWLAILLVILAFTRQATPVPLAMILMAWLWTTIRERSWRNEWSRPAAVALAVGAVAQLTTMILFPFNELRHFSEVNHLGTTKYVQSHLWSTLGKIPGLVVDMFARELRNYLPGDHGLQVLWVLALAALLVRFKTVYAAMFVGGFAACVLLTILDATGATSLRYFVPLYPVLLILVADLLRKGLERRSANEQAARPDTAEPLLEARMSG